MQNTSKVNSPRPDWLEGSRVILSPGKSRLFYNRHPWVFPGAIASIVGSPADGSVVALLSHTNKFVGWGIFNSKSKVRVRVYSWNQQEKPGESLFRVRIREAILVRQNLGMLDNKSGCRLISSEGDFLSGLTVDQYAGWLVMQVSSLGMGQREELLAKLLVEESKGITAPKGIVVRHEKSMSRLEGMEGEDKTIWGEPPPEQLEYMEEGIKLLVQPLTGQKTGAYLDQRANRREVGRFATGKTMLDAFCYAGGFGLQAAKQGAISVVGIDQSEIALGLAKKHAELNGLADRMTWTRADVFEELARREEAGESYGVVVLDPPKFAQAKTAVEEALRGYRRLYTLGMRLTESGGILVVCCCTGLITWDMLENLVEQVGAEERRNIRILQKFGPSPDHPVAASCRESAYLKCLVLHLGEKSAPRPSFSPG